MSDNIIERTAYNLRYSNGVLFCENRDMTIDEATQLRDALNNSIELMNQGKSNADIAKLGEFTLAGKILKEGTWLLGENARIYAYEPYKAWFGYTGHCVYFLHIEAKNWMKIGSTHDLYNRTKTHHKENTEYRGGKVVAFIQTPLSFQLEALFHKAFMKYRIRKEVFQDEPVLLWLQKNAGLVLS